MNDLISELLIFLSIVVLSITSPFYFYYYIISTDRLRANHYQVWERLGKPSLTFGASPKSSSNFIIFFLKKHYLEIDDDNLTRCCNKIRMIFMIGTFGGFLFFIMALFFIIVFDLSKA